MLHVDVDVPYVESFMGLTSSLRLGSEDGTWTESPVLRGKPCFFFWVVGAKPAGLKFWEKTLESQGILEHQDFPNGLMAFLRVSP